MTELVPQSPEAEMSVVGQLLAHPKRAGEVVGTLLEPEHFHDAGYRRLYDEIVTAYYADDPIDALAIGEVCAKGLSRVWNLAEPQVIAEVRRMAGDADSSDPAIHARLVKRTYDLRALLALSDTLQTAVAVGTQSPDEIAAEASEIAMKIATSTLVTHDLISFEDLGRRFVTHQRRLMAARARGIELGAYFGMPFIDNWTRGLLPTELMILAGPPGAGKSAVAWKAAQMFAERQGRKDDDQQVGTLILSLEMGEEPSSVRVAQTITGLDGGTLREGRTSDVELAKVVEEWGKRRSLPLTFNHSSALRANQMRALIVESIRRNNVGLVVIDHMRYFDMDGRFASKLEEDEEKVKFLKQRIAKDLNVAVVCLAHTTKGVDMREGGRPKLSDLRGSGQIAAEADFVAFVYRPFENATQDDRDAGRVKRTAAELLWEKNRHGLTGPAHFFFDPSTMDVH